MSGSPARKPARLPGNGGHANPAFEPDTSIEPVMVNEQPRKPKTDVTQNGGNYNAGFQSDEPAVLEVNSEPNAYIEIYNTHSYYDITSNSNSKPSQKNGHLSRSNRYRVSGSAQNQEVETGQEVHEYEYPEIPVYKISGNMHQEDKPYGFNRQESYKYKGDTEQERTKKMKETGNNRSHCSRICALVVAILILIIIGAIIYVVFRFIVNKPDHSTTTQLPLTTVLPPVQRYLVTTSAIATLDLVYSPSLADPNTSEYQQLEANFTSLMETAFLNMETPGASYEGVIVNSFSSGSVVVNFDVLVSYAQNLPPDQAAEQAAINAVENEVSAVLTALTADNSTSLLFMNFNLTGSNAEIRVPSTPNPTTSQEPIAPCSEYTCNDGLECYPTSGYCDGIPDCTDRSDEQFCSTCPQGQSDCLDGLQCYNVSGYCDGNQDCDDGSDELLCSSCPQGQTDCLDGLQCYNASGYCDGNQDCDDESDELFCSSCPLGQSDCLDGLQCYNASGYCDGNQDCDDGSDELFCSSNCQTNEIACLDGSGCYAYPDQQCDGIYHCTNGEDELYCPGICSPDELACATGDECYNATYQCDGYQDCTDQSDEQDCTSELVVVNLAELSDPYILSSPNYPDRYPLNANESWLFIASFGYRPRIDVSDLYTEPDRDLLSFYSGSAATGQPLVVSGALTRSGIISYQSSSENLYVTFRSDNAVSVRGFYAAVTQELASDVLCASNQYDCGDGMVCMPTDKSCSCPLPSADCDSPTDCFLCDSGKCIPFEEECDGERQCEFGEDERNCMQGCNGFLCNDGICLANSTVCDTVNDCTGGEDESGCSYPVGEETVNLYYGDIPYPLTSYGYPAQYPNNVHYSWKFIAGSAYKIRIRFAFFSTHDANDYVLIGDGNTIGTDPFLRLYGGGFVPEEILSQGGDIWITMVTNQNFRSIGFLANVTAVLQDEVLGTCALNDMRCGDQVCIPENRLCDVMAHCVLPSFNPGCPVIIELGGIGQQYQSVTSPFISLYSANYPSAYDDDINATVYLTAPAGQRILAAMLHFDTEEEYDFLIFYEGHSTSPNNQIARLSGLLPNQIILSTGNQMTIVFQSDHAYSFYGFFIEIEGQASDGSCNNDEFRCMNGQCRSSDFVCDGEIDCIDFSDEDKCPTCQSVPSQCSSVLPWTTTLFPNARFQTESDALQRYSELESTALSCNPSGHLLLCAALFPECPHYGTTRNLCPSVCEAVITDCPMLLELSTACSGSTVVDDNNGNPLCEARTGDVFNTTVCGTRPAYQGDVQSRIIGGTFAEMGEFPWIGSLRTRQGEQQCGATLLNEYWAITAAHCTGAYEDIIFGDLKLDTTTSYSVSPTIAQIIDHPNYFSTSAGDDISLIRFQEPVVFNDYVRPICLPSVSNVSETQMYRRCYAAGWGTLAFDAYASNDLLKVLLGIIDNDECGKSYDDIIPSKLCAGYRQGGYDTCYGDSGGPLACEGDDGRWHLVGITSYGNLGCGDPGFPGVYTRVSSFLDFIGTIYLNDQ